MWLDRAAVRSSLLGCCALMVASAGERATAHRGDVRTDADIDSTSMLEALGDRYAAAGLGSRSSEVFRELLREEPGHPHACRWQASIAQASLFVVSRWRAIQQIEKLVVLWRERKLELPARERQECHDSAAAITNDLAHAYHRHGADTGDAEELGWAKHLYEVFMGSFADSPAFAETEYFYAELSWVIAEREPDPRERAEKFAAAAAAFGEVVRTNQVAGKRLIESREAADYGRKLAQ